MAAHIYTPRHAPRIRSAYLQSISTITPVSGQVRATCHINNVPAPLSCVVSVCTQCCNVWIRRYLDIYTIHTPRLASRSLVTVIIHENQLHVYVGATRSIKAVMLHASDKIIHLRMTNSDDIGPFVSINVPLNHKPAQQM